MNLLVLFSSSLFAVFGVIESQSVLPFLELSENAASLSGVDDGTILFNFSTPFRFNNISSNGLVSFGIPFNEYYPTRLPLDLQYYGYDYYYYINVTIDIIAPYWDDIDLTVKGYIFFESYSNNEDNDYPLRNISDFITNSQALSERYNPLSATIIHWSNVCPIWDSNCSNPSSFQAVLTSDDTSSFAIFTYKCGSLNWNNNYDIYTVYATIGYSAGTQFYKNHILSMKSNVNDIACLNEPHSEWSNVVYRVDEGRPTECVADSVRLVRGSDQSEGQVEVCVSQFWHPVCDEGFTVNETKLICEALGYDFSEEGIMSVDTDPRDNNNELYEISCNNHETSLDDCSVNPCVYSTGIAQPFIHCYDIESPSNDINTVCQNDCNPSSRHEECCSDDNLGKFIKVKLDLFTIKYLVCPTNKPEYCT